MNNSVDTLIEELQKGIKSAHGEMVGVIGADQQETIKNLKQEIESLKRIISVKDDLLSKARSKAVPRTHINIDNINCIIQLLFDNCTREQEERAQKLQEINDIDDASVKADKLFSFLLDDINENKKKVSRFSQQLFGCVSIFEQLVSGSNKLFFCNFLDENQRSLILKNAKETNSLIRDEIRDSESVMYTIDQQLDLNININDRMNKIVDFLQENNNLEADELKNMLYLELTINDLLRKTIQNQNKRKSDNINKETERKLREEMEKEFNIKINKVKNDLNKEMEHEKFKNEVEMKKKLKKELKQKIEDKLRPQIEEEANSKMERRFQDQIKNQIKPQLEEELQKQIEEQIKPQLKKQIEDQMRIKLEKELSPKIESKIKPQIEESVRREIEPQLRRQIIEDVRSGEMGELRKSVENVLRQQIEIEIRKDAKEEFNKKWENNKDSLKKSIQKEMKTKIRNEIQKELEEQMSVEKNAEIESMKIKIKSELENDVRCELEERIRQESSKDLEKEKQKIKEDNIIFLRDMEENIRQQINNSIPNKEYTYFNKEQSKENQNTNSLRIDNEKTLFALVRKGLGLSQKDYTYDRLIKNTERLANDCCMARKSFDLRNKTFTQFVSDMTQLNISLEQRITQDRALFVKQADEISKLRLANSDNQWSKWASNVFYLLSGNYFRGNDYYMLRDMIDEIVDENAPILSVKRKAERSHSQSDSPPELSPSPLRELNRTPSLYSSPLKEYSNNY